LKYAATMESAGSMDNDSLRHDLAEVMARAKDQMRELAAVQQQRMALSGTGTAADGLVEVTVDAQRMVTSTVIGESYLQEFALADLGGHITTAAQAAAREVERRGAALLAPLAQRRQEISAMSGNLVDAPQFGELLAMINPTRAAVPATQHDDEGDDGWSEAPRFPTVKR
jgi:DNA-binding protein YbaB